MTLVLISRGTESQLNLVLKCVYLIHKAIGMLHQKYFYFEGRWPEDVS